MKATFNCKLCGKPGITSFDRDTPEEYFNMLLPMVTHNACYDRVTDFRKAGDRLVAAAVSLSRFNASRKAAGSEDAQTVAKSLGGLARRYCEAFAAYHSTPLVWDADFADIIRERPDMIGRILADYRKRVLSIPQEMPI